MVYSNWKRAISLLSCAALLAGTLSGCKTSSSTGSGSTGDSAFKSNEEVELSVAYWNIQDGFNASGASNDTIFNNLEKKFNVKIKPIQITWDDYSDKVKIWAASSQLPDIFASTMTQQLRKTWAKQGIIKELPSDMSAYPNLKAELEQSSVKTMQVNGKYYSLPRMSYDSSDNWVLDRSIIYRKDWAKQAGFTTTPHSLNDFIKEAKTVLKQHPSTAGLAINNVAYLTFLFADSFPELMNSANWILENGSWVPAWSSKKAETGIQEFRKLYTEGVLDRDFITEKNNDAKTKFYSGKAFAYIGGIMNWPVDGQAFTKSNPGVDATKAIDYMEIWPAADGNRYRFSTNAYWSDTYFNSKLSDDKFKRALQLIDYMSGKEYVNEVSNGIENVDWKKDGSGNAVSMLPAGQTLVTKYPITNNFNYLGKWNNQFVVSKDYVLPSDVTAKYFQQLNVSTYAKWKTDTKPISINFAVMNMDNTEKQNVGTVEDDIINTALPQVIIGKDDAVAMWEKVVQQYYTTKSMKDVIASVTAQAKKEGIS